MLPGKTTARDYELASFDTGQDLRLKITHHEIHRIDREGEDDEELIMSTLRYFALRCEVFEGNDDIQPTMCENGKQYIATLIYENGNAVQELSMTHEPALLGGRAVVEDGVATFRLKITVLSALCRSQRFRVQVAPVDRADLTAITSPMRTITKLRRGKERQDDHALRNDSCDVSGGAFFSGQKRTVSEWGADGLACTHQFDHLWAQVHENGNLLLKLQKQQSDLSRHLNELRELRGIK
jgi:hypothetical protein